MLLTGHAHGDSVTLHYETEQLEERTWNTMNLRKREAEMGLWHSAMGRHEKQGGISLKGIKGELKEGGFRVRFTGHHSHMA